MDRVSFLPKELRRSQKDAGTHLPTDDVGPLVNQEWKIAIGLDPLRKCSTDVGLRSRPDHQWFGQLRRRRRPHRTMGADVQAMMRYDCAFLGKTFHVLGLFFHVAERDEEREIGVAVSGRFEHCIELLLDIFPNAKAPWLDHHAAAYFRALSEISGPNNLLIPLGKIFGSRGRDR